MVSSSSVGTIQAATGDPAAEMRGPPRRLASSSSCRPSHAASAQTRARIAAAFSPTPPVKTSASSPPSAAASEPSSRAMR